MCFPETPKLSKSHLVGVLVSLSRLANVGQESLGFKEVLYKDETWGCGGVEDFFASGCSSELLSHE